MRHICLVTNFNYATFLPECLSSLLAQTRKFDLIIIIDDGSTDNSREIIESFCRDCDSSLPLFKANGGQLSCFNAALEFIEPSDLVFFLDADDVFPPDYLEQVCLSMGENRSEFIFSNPVRFNNGQPLLQSARIGKEENYTFASTSALTRMMHCWIGAVTSCLAMRGNLYHAIFPYPFERDWVTRADDVLIFGASILGSQKLHLGALGVNYRIHSSNKFIGRTISAEEKVDWRLRHERLFNWFSQKAGVPQSPPLKNTLHEAAVIPKSIRKLFDIPSPMFISFFNLLLFVPIMKILARDMTRSNGR